LNQKNFVNLKKEYAVINENNEKLEKNIDKLMNKSEMFAEFLQEQSKMEMKRFNIIINRNEDSHNLSQEIMKNMLLFKDQLILYKKENDDLFNENKMILKMYNQSQQDNTVELKNEMGK
jgi:hypothetical protein